GSIGLTTGLDPAMTLGCGGWGGNITSDNISPRHLINIKRLAYETTPAIVSRPVESGNRGIGGLRNREVAGLPKEPAAAAPSGISADVLARRIDEFLSARGYRGPAEGGAGTNSPARLAPIAPSAPLAPSTPTAASTPSVPAAPADFVCEEDVRQ